MKILHYYRSTRSGFAPWHVSEQKDAPRIGEGVVALCSTSPVAEHDKDFEKIGEFRKMGVKGWMCYECYELLSDEDREIEGYCPNYVSIRADSPAMKCDCNINASGECPSCGWSR